MSAFLSRRFFCARKRYRKRCKVCGLSHWFVVGCQLHILGSRLSTLPWEMPMKTSKLRNQAPKRSPETDSKPNPVRDILEMWNIAQMSAANMPSLRTIIAVKLVLAARVPYVARLWAARFRTERDRRFKSSDESTYAARK